MFPPVYNQVGGRRRRGWGSQSDGEGQAREAEKWGGGRRRDRAGDELRHNRRTRKIKKETKQSVSRMCSCCVLQREYYARIRH